MKKFEEEMNEINSVNEYETILNLEKKEKWPISQSDHYFHKNQPFG